MRDLGVSAFHGSHIKKGALGPFLTAIKAGAVPRGSYLLIENFDRLSRQEPLDAQDIVRSILKEGINLVTLTNEMKYSWEKVNREPHLLYTMTGAIILAHEESKKKQERVGAAWSQKRKNADSQILTTMCPSWLVADKENNKFKVIPERVSIVRKIFKMASEGLGQYLISKQLNRDGLLSPRGKHWSTSSVANILSSRSVLGEYQPHIREGRNKRIPVGDRIADYYPRIITDAEFNKVQQYIKSRKSNKTGRKDQNYNNLFASFIKCPYCGGPLNIDTNQYRAHKVKVYKYLYCHSNAQGKLCTSKRVRYLPFETAFLHHITEFNIADVFSEGDSAKKTDIENQLYQVKAQIEKIDQKLESLFSLATESTVNDAAKKLFSKKINTLADQKSALEATVSDLSSNLDRLQMNRSNPDKIQGSISSVIKKMESLSGDELYLCRAKLAQIIKNVVENVYVYTAGWPKDTHKKGDDYLYLVKFHNGSHRLVSFSYSEPEKYNIVLKKIKLPM